MMTFKTSNYFYIKNITIWQMLIIATTYVLLHAILVVIKKCVSDVYVCVRVQLTVFGSVYHKYNHNMQGYHLNSNIANPVGNLFLRSLIFVKWYQEDGSVYNFKRLYLTNCYGRTGFREISFSDGFSQISYISTVPWYDTAGCVLGLVSMFRKDAYLGILINDYLIHWYHRYASWNIVLIIQQFIKAYRTHLCYASVAQDSVMYWHLRHGDLLLTWI